MLPFGNWAFVEHAYPSLGKAASEGQIKEVRLVTEPSPVMHHAKLCTCSSISPQCDSKK